jgi:hypothetical protein
MLVDVDDTIFGSRDSRCRWMAFALFHPPAASRAVLAPSPRACAAAWGE